MNRNLILILCLAMIPVTMNAQDGRRLTILHTNDFHSHLQGFAPESAYTPDTTDGDVTTGGLSRIAGIIKSARSENPGSTLVVDGGDCLMGTFFHALEPSTGFQLPLMRKAGYDIVALGNHDFDYGPDAYASIVRASVSRGEIPALLLGNASTDPADPADDRFTEVVSEGLIKQYIVKEANGIRIGVFSLLGKDADASAPYAPPVTFRKIIPAAKKIVRTLKEEGCSMIICLSHSGLERDDDGEWTGEDVKLARKVRGIDLIISGHTHTLLEKPVVVNGIPIIQTGSAGRYVGKAEMEIKNGSFELIDYSLIPVDDRIKADMSIQAEIEAQQLMINSEILTPLGLEYSQPVINLSFPLYCDEYGDVAASNLGALVADAIYHHMNTTGPGTDIAMVAAGVIRDPLMPGTQSVADVFRSMSLGSGNDDIPGYPLSRLWVTGRELKNIIEILLMSAKSTPSHFCFYSHLRIEYDPEGGLFKKVKKIEFTDKEGNATVVDVSKDSSRLYSIVANSYMLDFVGIIRKKSFGLINVVPKNIDGTEVNDMDDAVVDFSSTLPGIQEGKEWIALVRYLQHIGTATESGVPVMPDYYREPARSLVRVPAE